MQSIWRRYCGDLIAHSQDMQLKTMYFRTFLNISTTEDALLKLFQIWNGELIVDQLPLGESEYIDIALEIALKKFEQSDVILSLQLERTQNSDRKERLEFIAPSTSADPEVRNQFFESLLRPENRENEPWVISALYMLHHPVHAEESIAYLDASLDVIEEIQQTGDIFFPKRWLDASFSGHNSQEAQHKIEQFLSSTEISDQLRMKVLQSADMVLRANSIIGNQPKL